MPVVPEPETDLQQPEGGDAPAAQAGHTNRTGQNAPDTPAESAQNAPMVEDPKGSGAGPLGLAIGIAAAFFLIAVVLLVLLVRTDSGTESADQTNIRTTSARLVEALISFDTNGAAANAPVVHELATGTLLGQFDQVQRTLVKTFKQLKLSSARGSIKSVYVGDIGNDQASTIVVADLTLVGQTTTVQRDQYLELRLVRLSGRWKVESVRSVNFAVAAGGATNAPGTVPPAASS